MTPKEKRNVQFNRLNRKAIEYAQKGQWQQAILSNQEILKSNPFNTNCLNSDECHKVQSWHRRIETKAR